MAVGLFSEVQGLFSGLLLLCFCFKLQYFNTYFPGLWCNTLFPFKPKDKLDVCFIPNLFLGFPRMETTNVFGFLSSTVMPVS